MEQDSQQTMVRRGRGRPSAAAVKEIDRRILDAAWTCFTARGFDAVSMDMVAEQAGVTKATLYARHEGKAGLIEAVVFDRLARWSAQSSRARGIVGETLADKLRHYGRSLLRWSRNEEIVAIGQLLRGRDGVGDELGRRLHSVLRAPMLDLLAEAIAAHVPPRPGATSPRLAATLFMGMLLGYPLVEADEPAAPFDPDVFVDHVVALFLHGAGGVGVEAP